jgi:phage tail sheath protein FI
MDLIQRYKENFYKAEAVNPIMEDEGKQKIIDSISDDIKQAVSRFIDKPASQENRDKLKSSIEIVMAYHYRSGHIWHNAINIDEDILTVTFCLSGSLRRYGMRVQISGMGA